VAHPARRIGSGTRPKSHGSSHPSLRIASEQSCRRRTVQLADADGGGRPELVLLHAWPGFEHGISRHTEAGSFDGGGIIVARLPDGDMPATIERLRSADGRPGANSFIHVAHSWTSEVMAVYMFGDTKLPEIGELSSGGCHAEETSGFHLRSRQPRLAEQRHCKADGFQRLVAAAERPRCARLRRCDARPPRDPLYAVRDS
jgi:hypothetical protein